MRSIHLNDEERQHILKDVNDTKMDVPQCSIRDLFEAQSVLSSNSLAASFSEYTLTYSELNSREPTCALSALTWSRPRCARCNLPGALVRDGDWPSSNP